VDIGTNRLYGRLIDVRGFKAEDIIVMGCSICGGVVVELAAPYPEWFQKAQFSRLMKITGL
jgi:hypothetical protein